MTEQILDVDHELQQYIDELTLPQKKSILEVIKAFIKKEEQKKPQTIEEYNKELEEAVTSVNAGEYYTHDEVKAMSKNW